MDLIALPTSRSVFRELDGTDEKDTCYS